MQVPAPWTEPLIHPTYARLLCALLRGRGLDLSGAVAAMGMTMAQLAKEESLLTFAQMRQLILQAVELTGSRALGLELGPAVQPAAHGPVGYAAVASGDLAVALDVIARYGAERMRGVDFRLAQSGDFVTLSIRERFDFGDVRIFVLETMLVTILGVLESLAGHPLDRVECLLPYPAPAWVGDYDRCVKGKVRFGAATMQIRLPRDLMETPCLTADAHVYASAREECERGLAEDAGLAPKLRVRLLSRDAGYPTLEESARELNMSGRSLIRKLKREGTSYQELLDSIRMERAAWYLRETTYPMEEIAARLGYADPSNFSRTCRRWFGRPPREMRKG